MENGENIDFERINEIKCTNQNNTEYEENQNDTIFFYDDSNKKKENHDNRGNSRKILEKNLNEMQIQFRNLSLKLDEIINSKQFNFKNFLINNLNIQIATRQKASSIKSEEKRISIEEKKFEAEEKIKDEKKDISKNSSISNDADSLFDVFIENSPKNNISSNILLGKKRATNNNKNTKKNEGIQLFKEILDLCDQNEKMNKPSNIKINCGEANAEILYNNTPIVNIYFENDKIKKLKTCSNNDIIFKEKEIIKFLKEIKKSISQNINRKEKFKVYEQ